MTFHCDWTVCTSHAVAMDLFYFDLSTFLWKHLTSVLSFVTLVEDAINQLKQTSLFVERKINMDMDLHRPQTLH